jgi:hypothetical protein
MGERVTHMPNEPKAGEDSKYPDQPQNHEAGAALPPEPPSTQPPVQAPAPHYAMAAPTQFQQWPAPPGPPTTPGQAAGVGATQPAPPPVNKLTEGLVPGAWWTGAAAGAAAYIATLVVAVVVTILAIVGMAASGSADAVEVPDNPFISGSELPSPWAVLFQFAAQLPALGMLGTLAGALKINAGMLGNVQASIGIFMVPLLISVVILAAAFWGSRMAEKMAPSATLRQRWAQAVIGGLVFSLLLNLVATIASISISFTDAASVRLNAANFASIAVAFLAVTLAGFAGRGKGSALAGAPAKKSYVRSLLRDLGMSATLHFGTFVVIAVPVLVIVVGIKAGWAATLSSPLWAPTAGMLMFGMGHFAAFGYHGAGSAGGMSSAEKSEYGYAVGGTMNNFGIPAWSGWLMVVLALVAICVAATYWYLRRGAQNPRNPLSWLYLPAIFLVAGTLVVWLSGLSATAGAGVLASGAAGVGLAWWTPFLMMLWGVVADVASRFLAPVLAPLLPTPLVSLIQKSPSTLAPSTQVPAQQAAAVPAVPAEMPGYAAAAPFAAPFQPGQQFQPQSSPAAPVVAAKAPMTPKAKRNLALGGGAAGLVVLLVVGGVVAVNVIRGSHGPDQAVESYLSALVAGDAQKAVDIADPSVPNDQRALLSNAVYAKATNRPESFSITSSKVTNDTAIVKAEMRQGGVRAPVQFTLVKKDPGFLDPHWSLQGVPLSELSVRTTAAAVSVNGVEVKLGSGNQGEMASASRLPAFPGTYKVELPASSKYLSADPATVTVGMGPAGFSESAELTPEPNAAFTSAVSEQVDAMLAKCASQKVLKPADCPFAGYAFGDVRNVTWKVAKTPTFKIYSLGGNTWAISSDEVGTAKASYESDSSYGFGTPDWKKKTDDASIYLSGKVTLDGDKLAVAFRD